MGEHIITVGDITHVRLHDGPNRGECRAAMIVRVWSADHKMVNLELHPDGTNDGPQSTWLSSRGHFSRQTPGNMMVWHWPWECAEEKAYHESGAVSTTETASGGSFTY